MSLHTRISLSAQRMIKGAFHDLEKTLSTEDQIALKDTTLEDVRKAAHKVENQLAARQCLRNMRKLVPLFTGLDHYSKSIEILCNGTPYLPWIWSPIKLILQVSSNFVEAFEKIISAYHRIGEALARFAVFDRAYSRDPIVQETLAIFYVDIVKFHKEAYQFVQRSWWKVFFLTSWGRFQRRFDGLIDDMRQHEKLIDKTSNAVNISEARAMRSEVEVWRQKSMEKLERDEEEHTLSQYRTIISCLKFGEVDQAEIFDTVASDAIESTGTSSWILKQPKIRSWMRHSPNTAFLVLTGSPGSGKSVISTQIATFLRSSGDTLIVTHFCTYLYETSCEYDNILQSILVQLIRPSTDLIAYVYEKLVQSKKAPSSRLMEELIREIMGAAHAASSQTRYIHLILDGIEECSDEVNEKVIRLLERVMTAAESSGSTVLKILLSRRVLRKGTRRSRKKHVISLSDEKKNLDRDMLIYCTSKLESLRLKMVGLRVSDAEITVLKKRIVEKADGMFLWVRLVLEYLSTNVFYKREEILSAVESLPHKLAEFYGRILTQLIANFNQLSVQRITSILGWIAFTKRPLRAAELRSALAFSTGDVEADELPPQYIFDLCAPLIERRRDSTFRFIHGSVKDYLQSPDSKIILSQKDATCEHGLATVTCLLSGSQFLTPANPEPCRFGRVIRGLHGFHIYATEYWIDYVLAAIHEEEDDSRYTKVLVMSQELAALLNQPSPDRRAIEVEEHMPKELDQRLTVLRQRDKALHNLAIAVLGERRKRYITGIKTSRKPDGGDNDLMQAVGVGSLLSDYQTVLAKILPLRSCIGVTFQELEIFKQEFRTSAFTCRLWSCPRASSGFDSDQFRLDHESTHWGFTCSAEGCPYPPFDSKSSLDRHRSKCHGGSLRVPRQSISHFVPTTLSAKLSEKEKKYYEATVDAILAMSDLETVSRRQIRKALEVAEGRDLSKQKTEIKQLIEQRFEIFSDLQSPSATLDNRIKAMKSISLDPQPPPVYYGPERPYDVEDVFDPLSSVPEGPREENNASIAALMRRDRYERAESF